MKKSTTIEKSVELIKHKRKERITNTIIISSCVLTLFGLLIGTALLDRYDYKKCLNNPPDTNWVEEDLEPVFMTTGVCVLDTNDEGKHIYYKVSANGFYYKVHYAVEHSFLFNYHWEMQHYIQISEEATF